jgi:hypothetical protein
MDGSMPEQASIRLAEVVAGGTFVVDSVDDRDATCLRLLEASGIKAGVTVRVKARTAVEGYSLSIEPSDEALDLSREMAGDIRIVAV